MADDVQKLIAQVEARYAKAEKEMSKFVGVVNKKMKEADDATKKASKQMEAQVAKAFNSMTSSVKTFIGAIAGVAAIRGFSAMTTGALKAAASIDVVGKSTNTTLRGLQELRYLATQAGADIAVMDDALKTLNVGLGEFRNEGGGPAVAVLKALGLESRVLAGEFETTDEAFIAILNRLREVPHAADRASMAAKLFGEEAGSKMGRLLDSTAVSIDEARKEANRLGLVLSDDMVRKAGEADAALSTLWQTIQMAGVRAIVENADAIRDLARAFADAMPGILDDLRAYAEWMGVIERTPMRAAQKNVEDLEQRVDMLKKRIGEPGAAFFGFTDSALKGAEFQLNIARELLKAQEALSKVAADDGRGDLPASAAGKPRRRQGLFDPDAESASPRRTKSQGLARGASGCII